MGESGKRTENIKEESVNLNNSTAMQKLPPLRLPTIASGRQQTAKQFMAHQADDANY